MGVRIDAYVVDIPRFDAFLDASLVDMLLRYQRDGRDPKSWRTFTSDNIDIYEVKPGGPIRAAIEQPSGRWSGPLSDDQLRTHELLQRSARTHLSEGGIYESFRLLRAFSQCAGIDFIEQLINGHRRWWIGGLLQAAEALLPDSDYQNLELLFRKILRGFNCGHTIPDDDVGFATAGLPFTPPDDPDERFGRWDDRDCRTAEALIQQVASTEPAYHFPTGPVGITPDVSEFHGWVVENIQSLLRASELDYECRNLLTFIG